LLTPTYANDRQGEKARLELSRQVVPTFRDDLFQARTIADKVGQTLGCNYGAVMKHDRQVRKLLEALRGQQTHRSVRHMRIQHQFIGLKTAYSIDSTIRSTETRVHLGKAGDQRIQQTHLNIRLGVGRQSDSQVL